MQLRIEKNIKEDRTLRESFMSLVRETFGFGFENWYEAGFWTDKYIPYSLVDGGRVVANASVNIMKTEFGGQPRDYVQIGTVMTAKDCRGQGLARRLLQEIQLDFEGKCDCVYLFANSRALEFYPKMGFHRAYEHSCAIHTQGYGDTLRKLDMSNAADLELIRAHYALGNPFSQLPSLKNFGLLMFYCAGFMRECVFYSERHDAVLILQKDEESTACVDIFGGKGSQLSQLAGCAARKEEELVKLGFTPITTDSCVFTSLTDDNDALFILNGTENLFADNKLRFPELSHA